MRFGGEPTVILVTGGLGFIGTHVTRSLLDLGESCVLAQRRPAGQSALVDDELGTRLFIEQVNIIDQAALLQIGDRHPITGIVHLAGAGLPAGDPVQDARADTAGLLNVLFAARQWGSARVGVASTIGVYGAAGPSPWREDMPVALLDTHPIPAFKKSAEVLAGYVGAAAGLEVYSFRVAGVWGPLGRASSMFFAAPALVHAAARGRVPDLASPPLFGYAEDGLDLCYARDCGRAVARLQTAGSLSHPTYNVGSGRPTRNREIVAAIERLVPDARIELPPGHNPRGPGQDVYLDITRLQQDTGFSPAYDIDRAVADYIGWLQAGHER